MNGRIKIQCYEKGEGKSQQKLAIPIVLCFKARDGASAVKQRTIPISPHYNSHHFRYIFYFKAKGSLKNIIGNEGRNKNTML